MQTAIKRLKREGFTEDKDAHAYFEAVANDLGMHANGPYQVSYVATRDDVTVLIEQNTVADVTYPPVAIVEGPKGRVACNPDDTDLLLSLVDEVG